MYYALSALLLLSGVSCFAQSLYIGGIGAVRATGDFTGEVTAQSKRYAAGPKAELSLPLGFAFEVDALYHPQGYDSTFTNALANNLSTEHGHSWEFPLLVKYRLLPLPLVKPYVEAGYAPRVISGSINSTSDIINPVTGSHSTVTTHTSLGTEASHGLVIGAGVQFGLGKLHLSPELRYTRWNNQPINMSGSGGFGFQSTRNQLEFLVGVSWQVFKVL